MRIKTIILMVCMGLQTLVAQAEYRTFTDAATGRTLEAELIRYDAEGQKVSLKLKGKGTKTVPISIFSDPDQKYIVAWDKNQDFLSEKGLVVEFSRRKKKDAGSSGADKGGGGGGHKKNYECSFAIELKNKSENDFNNVKLEYVVFYTQEHHINGLSDKKAKRGKLYGKQFIDLPNKSSKEIETGTIMLQRYKIAATLAGTPDLNGEIDGIILKLSFQSDTDETIYRAIRYPDGLKNAAWSTTSVDVQIPSSKN